MWVWLVVYVLAMQQTGSLSSVYPVSCPKTAGIGSSTSRYPKRDKQKQIVGWKRKMMLFFPFFKKRIFSCVASQHDNTIKSDIEHSGTWDLPLCHVCLLNSWLCRRSFWTGRGFVYYSKILWSVDGVESCAQTVKEIANSFWVSGLGHCYPCTQTRWEWFLSV